MKKRSLSPGDTIVNTMLIVMCCNVMSERGYKMVIISSNMSEERKKCLSIMKQN